MAFLSAVRVERPALMDRNHLERCHDMGLAATTTETVPAYVSLETEIPEVLYRGMKEFIGGHPHWDQYRVMSSCLLYTSDAADE